MFVQYDDEIAPERNHPWTNVVGQPDAQYWNFRQHPEKISEVLEDFTSWAHYPAIQRFYELIGWLNGPESGFETNDCGMIPPRVDPKTPMVVRRIFDSDPIGIHGRVSVLFRHLPFNTSKQTVDWLKKSIHDCLRDQVNNFPSIIFVGEWPHWFLEIDKPGHTVVVKFWAWGENEAHAMENLASTFSLLLELFKHLSDQLKAGSEKPATS
jgi:hypothetical protein